MKKLRAVIKKEYIQIVRDIPGLIILFLMPLILILAVTGTQENAFKKLYDNKSDILFVDNDHGYLGQSIEDGLNKSNYFIVVKELNGSALTSNAAREQIAAGNYQVGIVISQGATAAANAIAEKRIQKTLGSDTAANHTNSSQTKKSVTVYFDPAIRDSYRNAVISSLERLIQSVEIRIILNTFFDRLPGALNKQLQAPIKTYLLGQLEEMEKVFTDEIKQRMGEYLPEDFHIDAKPREVKFDMTDDIRNGIHYTDELDNGNIISIQEEYAQNATEIKPTLVQNNVPAFALFAMFFIVIPLAGSLLSERKEGSYNRIRTLPVRYLTILAGKVVVYMSICLFQLLLMIITGMYLLPLLYGMPPLELGSNYLPLLLVAFASALAAIAFGLLVGTFSNTQSQAGIFGSFMVVILGILGGIFLPVYMMPEPLKIASIISPIRWGIDSFLDIFVREAGIRVILPNLLRLVFFFAASLIITLLAFERRK